MGFLTKNFHRAFQKWSWAASLWQLPPYSIPPVIPLPHLHVEHLLPLHCFLVPPLIPLQDLMEPPLISLCSLSGAGLLSPLPLSLHVLHGLLVVLLVTLLRGIESFLQCVYSTSLWGSTQWMKRAFPPPGWMRRSEQVVPQTACSPLPHPSKYSTSKKWQWPHSSLCWSQNRNT